MYNGFYFHELEYTLRKYIISIVIHIIYDVYTLAVDDCDAFDKYMDARWNVEAHVVGIRLG